VKNFHVSLFLFTFLLISDGLYMYIEATSKTTGAKAQLISPDVTPAGSVCLQFYYHMYGRHIGTLAIYTRSAQLSGVLWTRSANQGNKWQRGYQTINETSPFKVRLRLTLVTT
jgi:hypothetical protein